MGKVSRKDKEKSAWIALGMLIDNLIEEYGFDRVYWLKHLSTSDFVIDLFNSKTGFWGEGVSFHTYRFMREMHLKSLPTVYEIKKMLESRKNKLIEYIAKKRTKRNLDKAKDIFHSTKTYTYLCIIDSDFYWKSFEELCYLVDRELDGDISAWEKQSGIRHSEIADLPQKIDLRNIPLEKIIGYKPPELSEEERKIIKTK